VGVAALAAARTRLRRLRRRDSGFAFRSERDRFGPAGRKTWSRACLSGARLREPLRTPSPGSPVRVTDPRSASLPSPLARGPIPCPPPGLLHSSTLAAAVRPLAEVRDVIAGRLGREMQERREGGVPIRKAGRPETLIFFLLSCFLHSNQDTVGGRRSLTRASAPGDGPVDRLEQSRFFRSHRAGRPAPWPGP